MFRVGQKVVCINTRATQTLGLSVPLNKGQIYTITSIDPEPDDFGGLAFGLAEVGGVFYAWRFRPVVDRKTDISIFTKMLTRKKRELVRDHG